MTRITVFTPTYNRANTLPRVYKSLLTQTYKEFVWLIIDDGSTDNTKELVGKWIAEDNFSIEYHYKENGGKHTAMRLVAELAKTKYILNVDSDDELMPEAVETFDNEWKKIEDEGLENQFAEIRGLTQLPDGTLNGDYYFPTGVEYIDSFWQEMVLKYKSNNENISCRTLKSFIDCIEKDEKIWLSDKISNLGESIYWARIGKKNKTRYINKSLYIVHYDAGDSLLRIHNKTKGHYNNLVGNKYFLDENLDYFWWNPKYFIHLILKFIISGIELGYSSAFLRNSIDTLRFKLFYSMFYPMGFVLWFYYKKIKRQFWF